MVLFGQPLIKISEAIWQTLRNFIVLSLCIPTVEYSLYDFKWQHWAFYSVYNFLEKFWKWRKHLLIAQTLACVDFLKKSMLGVDYHPICRKTIDLLWITGGGGWFFSFFWQKMMKLNKLSCQNTLYLPFTCVLEVQRVLLFVCLRNLLESRTSCRTFCRSERLITLICCAVTDILGSVEPNTNQEIKFRRLEES